LGKIRLLEPREKNDQLDDSTNYLERDELAGIKRLQRKQEPKSAYVFVNERGQPFERTGIARMIERAGAAAKLPFPIHVHMLRHSTGYASVKIVPRRAINDCAICLTAAALRNCARRR